MERQAPFGQNDHDSLQYHFRCGPIIGAARLFFTTTLSHASFWIYEAGQLNRLHDGTAPLIQDVGEHLNVSNGEIQFQNSSDAVRITLGNNVALEMHPVHDYRWGDTISTVIHQPDMHCNLVLGSRTHSGVAYCKRYAWTPAPRHWGYRFVQGWTDDRAALWTADANFGEEKYDYFRLLEPDGTLHEGDADASRHRKNTAYTDLSIGTTKVELTELAVWEAPLVSLGMDSMLRQRICELRIETPLGTRTGFAINETCYGTLG